MGCKTSTDIDLCLVCELNLHLDVRGVHWKFDCGQKGGKAQNKRSPLWGEGINGRKKRQRGNMWQIACYVGTE
jgi:hypothetical protein